jgi:macrolide transport system ATP-binding/permease protein
MALIRILLTRLVAVFARDRRDGDLNVEIQAHLDLLAREHVRRGASPEAARAAALRDFGGVEQVKEAYRDRRGFPLVDAAMRDVRYALRQMRRSPVFALVSIGSIAIGIAATAAVFAFLEALVLNPLPYAGADRMVTMAQVNKAGQGRGGVPLSAQEFAELRAAARGCAELSLLARPLRR